MKSLYDNDTSVRSLLSQGKAYGLRSLGLDGVKKLYRERAKRIQDLERQVSGIEAQYRTTDQQPVLFFDASSHLGNFSFNAAAGLLMTWGLRVSGHPVVYLVCHSGLGRCVQGTNRLDPTAPPPCERCISLSNSYYPQNLTVPFTPAGSTDHELTTRLECMTLGELQAFQYNQLPIGKLCVPSVRWALRRQDLDAIPDGRRLLAAYIASAVELAKQMERVLIDRHPRALLTFNGTFYPEATARAVAMSRDVPVVTYEGGHAPDSVFFSHELATKYSIEIPPSFEMKAAEDAELDEYLEQRFEGNFSMVGTRFWPDMEHVGEGLKIKSQEYRQIVTVFTNVAFDTSQIFTNVVFASMNHWLEETMSLAARHPDVLFVVRAHPAELLPGKESREPVGAWLGERDYSSLANVEFIPATSQVSSYELVRLSQMCLVYNSTVGLEAAILGVPVVMGGWSRYIEQEVTYSPASPGEYKSLVDSLLRDGVPPIDPDWVSRARRYMYYSQFRASLSFSDFIEPIERYQHTIKLIDAQALLPDQSKEMSIICEGIINGQPFQYP